LPKVSKFASQIIKAAAFSAAFLAFSLPSPAKGLLKAPAPVLNLQVAAPMQDADTVSMLFLGDLMMHSRQLAYDSKEFLKELEPLMSEADITVAGAEFTLAGPPYMGYPLFSAPDNYVSNIRSAGVDVLLLANNHILDHGRAGFVRTLKKIGGLYCGAGADSASYVKHNPLIIRSKGVRIALVNFTYGTNMGASYAWPKVSRMNKAAVSEQMKRGRKADFLIALPHWGDEYELRHNKKQEDWAEFLAAEGADAIIGAHPHVVQDTAFVRKVPVIYSLGNVVSNMSAPNTRLELAVLLRLVYSRPSGKTTVLRPELHFLWCCLPGKLKDNYCTIRVEDYIGKRELWKDPSDYDNMLETYNRVIKTTKIEI
jgi:poly-gamma-glutamate synthesis protein (capsule biosynthesis protein)